MFGGVCWYCHWGWPKPVAEIYRKSLQELDGDDRPLKSGPAHIVWEDENFSDDDIKWCLELLTDEGLKKVYQVKCSAKEYWEGSKFEWEEMKVVERSLQELLKVPEEIRLCVPKDYDGKHPEDFPPQVEVEKR